jgi:hypothetical protein
MGEQEGVEVTNPISELIQRLSFITFKTSVISSNTHHHFLHLAVSSVED